MVGGACVCLHRWWRPAITNCVRIISGNHVVVRIACVLAMTITVSDCASSSSFVAYSTPNSASCNHNQSLG